MTAYYNEFDPKAAAWLRQLIINGDIADGTVDERSIIEVEASDLEGFTQHHFFAGVGVWSYALRNAGWGDDRPVATASLPCQPFSAAGNQKGKEFDIAVDPVEGTNFVANNLPGGLTVLSIAEKGNLFNAPETYMDKIATGKIEKGLIDLDYPLKHWQSYS